MTSNGGRRERRGRGHRRMAPGGRWGMPAEKRSEIAKKPAAKRRKR